MRRTGAPVTLHARPDGTLDAVRRTKNAYQPCTGVMANAIVAMAPTKSNVRHVCARPAFSSATSQPPPTRLHPGALVSRKYATAIRIVQMLVMRENVPMLVHPDDFSVQSASDAFWFVL